MGLAFLKILAPILAVCLISSGEYKNKNSLDYTWTIYAAAHAMNLAACGPCWPLALLNTLTGLNSDVPVARPSCVSCYIIIEHSNPRRHE